MAVFRVLASLRGYHRQTPARFPFSRTSNSGTSPKQGVKEDATQFTGGCVQTYCNSILPKPTRRPQQSDTEIPGGGYIVGYYTGRYIESIF